MGDLGPYPDFSTSPTAAKRKTCLRLFYLATYESWGGWYSRPEFAAKLPKREYGKARTAYILKNAKSRFSLLGIAVHTVAERYLRAARLGQTVDKFEARRNAATKVHDVIEAAVAERWRDEPKKQPAVLEVLYGTGSADDVLQTVLDALPSTLETLEASTTLRLAIEAVRAGRRVDVERMTSITVGPAKVWVIPDLAFDDEEGAVQIVDWKTGRRRENDERQVGTYALALRELRPGVPVKMRLVYLGDDPGEVVLPGADEAADEARAAILTEAEACRALVVDGDLERNEPLAIEAFPMLPPGSEKCRWCDFRRMCGRG